MKRRRVRAPIEVQPPAGGARRDPCTVAIVLAGWRLWAAVGLAATPACAAPSVARSPLAVNALAPAGRCDRAAVPTNPLVTEWSASEKAHLESMAARAAVGVAYVGCELEVVGACTLPGRYAFRRTTRASDTVEVGSLDAVLAAEAEVGEAGQAEGPPPPRPHRVVEHELVQVPAARRGRGW
jgi:hypothetical protein